LAALSAFAAFATISAMTPIGNLGTGPQNAYATVGSNQGDEWCNGAPNSNVWRTCA
jgi:hypothetical protein